MTGGLDDTRVYLDGGTELSTPYEHREKLREMPPSRVLTYKTLEWEGGLTQKEIVEESMMSQRTVRQALNRLQEEGLVSEKVYIPDARQRLYEIELEGNADTSGELKSVEER